MNRDPRMRMTIFAYKEVAFKGAEYRPFDQVNHSGKGYPIKKGYINSEFNTNGQETVDKMIIRYAEVLLSYAEAKIELGQIDQTVYDAINQVRHRAGMPNVDQTKYNDQSSLRTLVRRERRVEFAYEGLRRLDIQRWGIMKDVMPETIYHMNGTILDTKNAEGDYNVKLTDDKSDVEEVRHFTTNKNEYLPVPQTVIDVDPKISQNHNY